MPFISILIDAPFLDQSLYTFGKNDDKSNLLNYLPEYWHAVIKPHTWQSDIHPLVDTHTYGERPFIWQIASELQLTQIKSIPCAAYEATQDHHTALESLAYAYLSPCHYQLGRDHILLRALTHHERDHEDVFALMQTIEFLWQEPRPRYQSRVCTYPEEIFIPFENQYIWQNDHLDQLFCHGFAQSLNRPLDTWLPKNRIPETDKTRHATRFWKKLHNEIQMVWFDHPINVARQKDHLPPINGLWMSAAGQCSPPSPNHFTQIINPCTPELNWLIGFCQQRQLRHQPLNSSPQPTPYRVQGLQ